MPRVLHHGLQVLGVELTQSFDEDGWPISGEANEVILAIRRCLEDARENVLRRDRALPLRPAHLDHCAAETRLQLRRRVLRDHFSTVDDGDFFGEQIRFFEVLRREKNGRAFVGQLADRVPQRAPALRVEARRRLVQEKNGRAVHQRRGNVEATAHPTRVGLHGTICGIRKVEPFEQLVRARAIPLFRHVCELAHQAQVFPPGEIRVDRRELPCQADAIPHSGRLFDDVFAEDDRSPLIGTQDRGEDPDRRGLACAVRAEQPEDLAAFDLEIDALQRFDVAETFLQTFNDDRWFAHGKYPCRCILSLSSF